jgi:hypothetical protein
MRYLFTTLLVQLQVSLSKHPKTVLNTCISKLKTWEVYDGGILYDTLLESCRRALMDHDGFPKA